MLPIILLYAAGGALLTGGLFGGKAVIDLANDENAKHQIRRRMANERELIREALETDEVREEARRAGVDLDALQLQILDSRQAQDQLLGLLMAVLRRHGATPDSVRQLLGD